jgi:acyl-CoA synthetase (NDP forming)
VELETFDADRAREVAVAHLEQSPDGGWLSVEEVVQLLDAAGVPTARSQTVAGAEAAVSAATDIGFPVVLKAVGPDLLHKSDVGGVRLGLKSTDEVASAYAEMANRLGGQMEGAMVQQMAEPGVETIVGVVQDPLFGPLVMFGLGGVATELLGDRAFRILPLTDLDAAELVRNLRSSPLLFGYRGAPKTDTDALELLLQRVARLAGHVAEIAELDLNPVVVSPSGVMAVDARVRVAPVVPGPPPDLRRMS